MITHGSNTTNVFVHQVHAHVHVLTCTLVVISYSNTVIPYHTVRAIHTSWPVGMCLASFTLAKLPLPIVFRSLYLPTYTSSPGGREEEEEGLLRLLDEELPPCSLLEEEEGRWWWWRDEELELLWPWLLWPWLVGGGEQERESEYVHVHVHV